MKISPTARVKVESVQSSTQQNFSLKQIWNFLHILLSVSPNVALQEFSNHVLRQASRETKPLIEPTILNLFCKNG